MAIVASAPVRICDNGGWTDTWFGQPGRVLNVAVTPGVEVTVASIPGSGRVVLNVETFRDRYEVGPGPVRVGRHRLLEAAIDSSPPPSDLALEISVRSAVPPGCGTGTSAAVAVALLGALAAVRGEQPFPDEVAYAAHRLETDVLGGESGIQDQLSAARGGINYLEIDSFPRASVRPLPLWDELGTCLTLVYLGRAHDSSSVHRQVMADLAGAGPAFTRLRGAAAAAKDAVLAQDLPAFGRALIDNTESQRALHPDLVGHDARRLIQVAQSHGAIGWKVNGAGGDGGSVSILSPTPAAKYRLDRNLAAVSATFRVLPVTLSHTGLHVRGDLTAGASPQTWP